jgi:hypothetical protein
MPKPSNGLAWLALRAAVLTAGCTTQADQGSGGSGEARSGNLTAAGETSIVERCGADDLQCQIDHPDSGTRAKMNRLEDEIAGAQLYVSAHAERDRAVVDYYDDSFGRWFAIEVSAQPSGIITITRGVHDGHGNVQNYFVQTFDMNTRRRVLIWRNYDYAASLAGVARAPDFDLRLDGAALRAVNTEPAPEVIRPIFYLGGGRLPDLGILPFDALFECSTSCGLTQQTQSAGLRGQGAALRMPGRAPVGHPDSDLPELSGQRRGSAPMRRARAYSQVSSSRAGESRGSPRP